MRGIKTVACGCLCVAGLVFAQPPGGPPAQHESQALEQLLAKALANSPEGQIAEAKLREADAELRKTRLSLMQKVIELQSTIETQKRQVTIAESGLARISKLVATGTVPNEELQGQQKSLMDAKSALARSEGQLSAICGTMPEKFLNLVFTKEARPEGRIAPDGRVVPDDGRPPQRRPHPAMADKIRQALDAPTKSHAFDGVSVKEVIGFYRELTTQVPFVAALGDRPDSQITLQLNKDLPLGAHFQALQDVAPGLLIFVRDYGFFFTFDTPPDDGVPYLDFWHETKPKKVEMRPQ